MKKAEGVCLGWACILKIIFHVFIYRLKSSSEQEDVKEGISYCIIIEERQQIGSASECCIPKVMKLSKEWAYDKT